MYVNPEGFIGLGGHAAAVSRVARRISDDEVRRQSVWRDAPEEVAEVNPTSFVRSLRVLSWTGDRLIAAGAWLKSQSGPSYQHA